MQVEERIAQGELRWVSPIQLRPNGYNPNAMDAFMYAKELASIRRFGFAAPIITRDHDGIEIIDGENRWKVATELGLQTVPIWHLGDLPDPEAKQLTIVLNETHGSPERQKLSDLLRDLLTSETTDSLLSVLPYSKEAFDELLNVPKFDWEEFDQAEPKIGEGWVERTYRLPREVAQLLDRAIAQAKEDQDVPDAVALERIAADFLAN